MPRPYVKKVRVLMPCGHKSVTQGFVLSPDSSLTWCKTCGRVYHAETLKKFLKKQEAKAK